jgi:hypothetical protein
MAGVKLVENLASFTDAYGTNKNFKKRDKVAKLNPWADAGSLSRDKYFDPDKTTGSAQWKGLLDDICSKNPLQLVVLKQMLMKLAYHLVKESMCNGRYS